MEGKTLNNKKLVILTHNSKFHADDCFAVATLLLYLGKEVNEVELIRSRDTRDIDRADFVVDVGGIYDEEKNRFDHHQEGGAGKRENGIPYATFGLVWKKFGEKICGTKIAEKIDTELVTGIDANDNGIVLYNSIFPHVNPYSLPEFVNTSNVSWKESPEKGDERFIETMVILRTILKKKIQYLKDEEEAAQKIIQTYKDTEDKRIIVLDKNYPWEAILSQLPEPLFCIWLRSDGTWGVKTVRDDISKFVNRKDFPQKWAGKSEGELQKITRVSDAVFCHNNRFMAVAKSKEGAIALAKLALKS